MSPVRILAIEDDPIHAESLNLIIEELGYVLIGITNDIHEFKRLVKATIPDLLLIDIDLGDETDGIDLSTEVGEFSDAPVIFLTAYRDSDTILRARDSLPSAYITKPYDSGSLQAAIELAVLHDRSVTSGFIHSPENESLFVKSADILKKVSIPAIQHIEVREKYCHIYLADDEIKVKMRLKNLLESLPRNAFIQVHRSFVVRKDGIKDIDANLGKLRVGSIEIPIGKNYRHTVHELINAK